MVYIHTEELHNLISPTAILHHLEDTLPSPKSVIDVGCGIGTFLNVFKQRYCCEVHGIDGAWTNAALLGKYILPDEYEVVNLEEEYMPIKRYDLAVCLEVIEHIRPESEMNIIKTLTNCSDIILFSAAVPDQPGRGHINCRWPTYWEKKFNEFGYTMLDIIRPKIWDDENIFWWYKQNMFLVVKNELVDSFQSSPKILDLVHPGLYNCIRR